MKNRKIAVLSVMACLVVFAACSGQEQQSLENPDPSVQSTQAGNVSVSYSDFDFIGQSDVACYTDVVLSESRAEITGNGAAFQDGVVTVSAAGNYRFSGTLPEGQIVVDAPEDAKVVLLFDGVAVTSSAASPVAVNSADKVAVFLGEGSENVLSDLRDSTGYDSEDEGTNAALYSACSLNITGTGSLKIAAAYNHGVYTKKNLKILGGTVEITAQNAGLKGKNSVTVRDGTVVIDSQGDGIKTSETEDTQKGYICLEGGAVTVRSNQDGISASLALLVSGGKLDITTTGQVSSSSSAGPFSRGSVFTTAADEASSKAMKAGASVTVTGGDITLSATGHALHSSGTITIDGGVFQISSSSGKGMSAHGDLTINGGTVEISKSTEGIESKGVLTVNDGAVRLAASDDGLNAGGNASGLAIHINGGYVFIDAGGDGIDSNGNLAFNGGTVIVAGPTANMDGALDASEGGITMNGGTLLAYSSAGMIETPDSTSTQNVVSVTFDASLTAGTVVCIQDSAGNTVAAFQALKAMQNVIFSSAQLQKGERYTVYTQGSCSGELTDGVYSGGEYTPGVEAFSLTVQNVITTAGSPAGGGGFGGQVGGGNPGQGEPGGGRK